jgi:hypothetical protein
MDAVHAGGRGSSLTALDVSVTLQGFALLACCTQ